MALPPTLVTQSLDVTSALRYKLSASLAKPAREGRPGGSHQLQQRGGWRGNAGEGQVRERYNSRRSVGFRLLGAFAL